MAVVQNEYSNYQKPTSQCSECGRIIPSGNKPYLTDGEYIYCSKKCARYAEEIEHLKRRIEALEP